MAQTLVQKSVLDSDGSNIPMPFNQESVTGSNFPLVQSVPGDIGGCSTYELILAATTNATIVKATPGQLYGLHVSSIASAVTICIKLYDLAVAPTVGTSTIKRRLVIPAGGTPGDRWDLIFPTGIVFGTGIAFAATTEQTDVGTTAVAAISYILTLDYK